MLSNAECLSPLSAILRVATDTYRLRAQLLPALLVVLPWFAILFPNHPLDPRRMLVTATLALGVGSLWPVGLMWFLGLVVHACGYRRRRQLFRGRGQRPAIRMLRHRDPTVDPATKQAWRDVGASASRHRQKSAPTRKGRHNVRARRHLLRAPHIGPHRIACIVARVPRMRVPNEWTRAALDRSRQRRGRRALRVHRPQLHEHQAAAAMGDHSASLSLSSETATAVLLTVS